MSVLGVDLRASPKKPSSIAVLDTQSHLTELGSFYEDSELTKLVDDLRPDLVAIGAPLNLPSGFCCLDQTCDCRFSVSDRKGRLLELQLAKMGTPTPPRCCSSATRCHQRTAPSASVT